MSLYGNAIRDFGDFGSKRKQEDLDFEGIPRRGARFAALRAAQ